MYFKRAQTEIAEAPDLVPRRVVFNVSPPARYGTFILILWTASECLNKIPPDGIGAKAILCGSIVIDETPFNLKSNSGI